MMMKTGIGMAIAAFLLAGCSEFHPKSETRNETTSIDLDKSEAAHVELRMGAGELHVKSGTSKLMEANFAFNVPEWKPVVNYNSGTLKISQPSSGLSFGNTVYTWDLKLNEQIPLHVATHLGAGKATMELGAMNLRNVEVNVGAGELELDLRGDPKHDYNVRVQGGVGQATVRLPKDVAISATASGALGEIRIEGLEKREGVWVNPEHPTAPATVHIDVKGGVGEIRLLR